MSEEQKQTVVDESEAVAEPTAEETNAQDEGLDELLSQFDQAVPEQKAEQQVDPNAALVERLNSLEAALAETQTRTDMVDVIKDVRGELDAEMFDDDLITAWVDAKARKNPALAEAWKNRNLNQAAFKKVVQKLGSEFSKYGEALPDKNATEDREAVTAAVRGASKKAPEALEVDESEVAQMSDAQFEAWKRSQAAAS